ncbi:hypothetical protein [Nannocystis punicea]|uniref:Uncharacterized protein n=1 Tax=Nannocystis punicea TaxID=2995304 RepID=A0ABY7HHL6_9BACT|nr:hypothetical protein [Nannocystis poenicansa]WAS98560.1 hypothetical protein O0S08_20660 [Nannocystis poenicansa]
MLADLTPPAPGSETARGLFSGPWLEVFGGRVLADPTLPAPGSETVRGLFSGPWLEVSEGACWPI